MLLRARLLFQVFFHSLSGKLFFDISNFAEVCTPSCQAKADNEVEKDDVGNEPPVKSRGLFAALVVNSTPELHLHKEHASTNEEVEAEKEFWNRLQALGEAN